MLDGANATIDDLPENLKQYVQEFDIETATSIDLSQDNIQKDNIPILIELICEKYQYASNVNKQKLLAIQLTGATSETLQQHAEKAYADSLSKTTVYWFSCIYPSDRVRGDAEKNASKIRNIAADLGPVYDHIEYLDPSRQTIAKAAFESGMKAEFDKMDSRWPCLAPVKPGGRGALGQAFKQCKHDYILEKAKQDFEQRGLGLTQPERANFDTGLPEGQSLLSYSVGYAAKKGFVNRNSTRHVLEDVTYGDYHAWLWPKLQQEAKLKLAVDYELSFSDFDFSNETDRKKFFVSAYGGHYAQRLKNQSMGYLNFFPETYAGSIYHKEMIQAGFDFMALGAFQNNLGEVKLELRKPMDVMEGMSFDMDEYLDPLVSHLENGRPLPFTQMSIKHHFGSENILEKTLRIAKAIADRPNEYHNLSGLELDWEESDISADQYLVFLDDMISLADRDKNPLRTAIDLAPLNAKFIKAFDDVKHLVEGVDEPNPQHLQAYEKAKAVTEKISKYRATVNLNRREQAFHVLLHGEESLGQMKGYEAPGGTVKTVESWQEVRPSKRNTSLDAALRNAGVEQEMEQQESQEKSQEKEQEQEQEQEQQQQAVVGSPSDNLANFDEFNLFVREQITYSISKEKMERFWHGMCGNYQADNENYIQNPNMQSISKEAVRIILKDPDHFQNGFVDSNLPRGYHFGTLSTSEGDKKGIYYDSSQDDANDENPLTIKFQDPVPRRARLKADPDHFKVKEKLSEPEKFAVRMAIRSGQVPDDILDPPTRDEIERYNNGQLFGIDGWLVAGKMAFCTSTKLTPKKYLDWYNDPITKALQQSAPPQEIAEQSIALGGDAIFELTKRLNKVKKRAKGIGKESLFDTFLDNFILQKDNLGWLQAPKFCDHIIRHDQFAGMEKLIALEDDEFEFFMAFFNQHAKHHTTPNLNELYNNYIYFLDEFRKIAPNHPLPIDDIETFASTCTDMKVGLDRSLHILRKAKHNNLLDAQMKCLTQLDLDYANAYTASVHHGYRVILPEMRTDKAYLKTSLLSKKSNISALQTAQFYNAFHLGHDRDKCRVEFYRQFALVDTPPNLTQVKKLDHFIQTVQSPEYQHLEQVQAFLYTIAGYCCFHANGLSDVNNWDKLSKLAKTVDRFPCELEEQRGFYAQFLTKISESQIDFFTGNEHVPPTLDRLTHYINTIERLHAQKDFVASDSSRNRIDKCFDPAQFFINNSDLYTPISALETKPGGQGDKLTDKQLGHLLIMLERHSAIGPQEDNPTKEKFAKMQGGLLHLFALISQPDVGFTADVHNDKSLAHFIAHIKESVCSENDVGYAAVMDVLNAMQVIKWEMVDQPYPSFEQLQLLINNAAMNPQPNMQAVTNWIKQQNGFALLTFEEDRLADKPVTAEDFDDVFADQVDHIIGLIETEYEEVIINKDEFTNFAEFCEHLENLNLEEQGPKFKQKILPVLNSTYFQAVRSGIENLKEPAIMSELTKVEREQVQAVIENNYHFDLTGSENLEVLQQQVSKAKRYFHHANEVTAQLNATKKSIKGQYRGINRLLMNHDISPIPLPHLAELLKILQEDCEQTHLYKKELLTTIVKYPNLKALEDKWPAINNILSHQVIQANLLSLESTTLLVLNVAQFATVRSGDFNKILALADNFPELTQQFVITLNKALEDGYQCHPGQLCQAVSELLDNDCAAEELLTLLQSPISLKIVDDIAALQDNEKKNAIIQILNQTIEASDKPSADSLKMLIVQLEACELKDLNELAKLEIDATFPEVTNLSNGLAKMHREPNYQLEQYLSDLQVDFFSLKNNPETLDMIFNDDRVIDVLNESKTLDYKDPQCLRARTKQKLLEEYAYIHALGYDKPLYHGKPAKDLSKKEIKELTQILKQKMQDTTLSDQARHTATLQMIALSREVYYRANLPDIRFPYSTQVISLLTALNNGDMNINQISTGQGKSLTAALYGTIMWAKGQPTVVCTSNLTLASEGLEENQHYYDYLGIPTALVRAQSSSQDFKQDGINYSDVSNLALFLAKSDIKGDFHIEKPGLVLDEVDFTVLDEVTDFRYAVNLNADGLDSEENLDEWFYYQLNHFVDSPEFTDALVDRDSDVTNAIAFLEKQLKQQEEQGLVKEPLVSHLRDRLIGFKAPNSDERKQLDTWIDSAQNAKIIHKEGENREWTLEQYDYKGEEYSIARIISHHRVSKGSKWSKGVHQFLHARINHSLSEDSPIPPCRIESEKAHVAALSSKNFVDYFSSRGGAIWGMTGTVGSAVERAELHKRYGFKLAEIETHQKRTAEDLPALVVNGSNEHVNAIYKNYKKQWQDREQMPTVIFEENADIAGQFKTKFMQKLTSKISRFNPAPTVQFYNGIEHELYDYDPQARRYVQRDLSAQKFESTEEKEDYIKKQAGLQNTITITTPMMGRGTDFKPILRDKDQHGNSQKHPFGLFVMQAYAESSVREERQIQGRMGRQGQRGLYMNIIDNRRLIDKLEAQGIDIPKNAKHFKVNRLCQKLPKYKKSKNINLATERRMKQTFGDMRGHFYQKFIGMVALAQEDKRFNEIRYILGDKEDFDEEKFKENYNKRILNLWNRFLINIDKKFILLRDECNGDYEAVFARLQEECYKEWNDKFIKQLRNNMGLNDDDIRLEADALFSEFRAFKDDELESYATLQHLQHLFNDERVKLEQETKERAAIKQLGIKQLEHLKTVTDDPNHQLMIDLLIQDPLKQDEYCDQLFPEHQKIKLAKQQYLALTKNESINVIQDVIKPEEYNESFNENKYSSVMGRIIESGREALVRDPEHTYRKDLSRQVVNYNKHYWMQQPEQLTQADNPEHEIAAMIAIDALDAIQKLNKMLDQDKLIDVSVKTPFELLGIPNPYPDDKNRANKALCNAIKSDPTHAYKKLNAYFMEKSITAQMHSGETHLKSTQYIQLFYQYHKTQMDMINELSKLSFTDTQLISRYQNSLNKYQHKSHMQSVKSMVKSKLQASPTEALEMQINNADIHFAPYQLDALKNDIIREIDEYLADKSKLFKRKSLAKSFKQQVNACDDMTALLEIIRVHRQSAIETDIKKSSVFRTRNTKGSRFQSIMNHAEERAVISAEDPVALLECANHVRKEMVDQFRYITGVLGAKNDIFLEEKLQLGLQTDGTFKDIKLKDFNLYIDHLSRFIARIESDPTINTAKAKSGIALLKANHEVLVRLRNKMQARHMDLNNPYIVVSDNKERVVEKLGLVSITSYFSAIHYLNPTLLTDEDQVEKRMQLFNLEHTLSLPDDMLGQAAKNFQKVAQQKYELDGDWAPPLSQTMIDNLYVVYDQLDSDLTSEPQWEAFWTQYELQLKETFEPQQAKAKVAQLQQEVLSAYRYKVIQSTHFLEKKQFESENEFQLREARSRYYLQSVNRLKGSHDKTLCYETLRQNASERLTNEIEKASKFYATQLKQGKPLPEMVALMDRKLARFSQSHLFEYLGEDAQILYQPLKEKHEQRKAFLNFINKELNDIAQHFLPSDSQDVHDRVINLIEKAVDNITQSEIYKGLDPKIAAQVLKSHLSSKESIQRVYQTALEARTDYYKTFLPNQFDELINNKKTGVQWIGYPRSRREVLGNIANIILSNDIQYDNATQQQDQYIACQRLYVAAITEDLKHMQRDQAIIFVEKIKSDPMLQAPQFLGKKQKREWEKQRKEMLNQWHEMANKQSFAIGVPKIFDPKAHTGLDISVGLLQKLEQTIAPLEKTESVDVLSNPSQSLSFQSSNSQPQRQSGSPSEKVLMTAEQEAYFPSGQYSLADLENMLFDPEQHAKIIQILSDIDDLDERIVKIEALFDEAVKTVDDVHVSAKYSQLFRSSFHSNQSQAIQLLQSLYKKAVIEQTSHMAHHYAGTDVSRRLPDHLSDEGKSEIYQEICQPALEHRILNTDKLPIHERAMVNDIKEMMRQIDSLPDDPSQTQRSTMGI